MGCPPARGIHWRRTGVSWTHGGIGGATQLAGACWLLRSPSARTRFPLKGGSRHTPGFYRRCYLCRRCSLLDQLVARSAKGGKLAVWYCITGLESVPQTSSSNNGGSHTFPPLMVHRVMVAPAHEVEGAWPVVWWREQGGFGEGILATWY